MHYAIFWWFSETIGGGTDSIVWGRSKFVILVGEIHNLIFQFLICANSLSISLKVDSACHLWSPKMFNDQKA